ncbi:hypothetical protein [Asaia prunellae]|uniref:hypothetical protein n=1 Tax=Asaia prunellae TaxID=610245 RepID=UPI0004712F0D|nr:hypothetical protein [Asaia prunellae]
MIRMLWSAIARNSIMACLILFLLHQILSSARIWLRCRDLKTQFRTLNALRNSSHEEDRK